MSGFVPAEASWVSVAGDGTLATVREAARVTIVELPRATAFAEIGVDPDAEGSDVAWIGAPPRLLVLARYAAGSTVHLLDPLGPHSIAELQLEAPMRVASTVGQFALVLGGTRAGVLSVSEPYLTLYPFPARTVPAVAGAGAGVFLVALAGTIEEWDPVSRTPKRRFRLPRVASITALGGNERLVWFTTQQEPTRIDVIPLINRGQPRAHDLPEPIERIVGHPRSDVVACIGAETGQLYVVDLEGRAPQRVVSPAGGVPFASAGLIVGRQLGVVAAQAGQPLVVASLDGRALESDDGAARGEGGDAGEHGVRGDADQLDDGSHASMTGVAASSVSGGGASSVTGGGASSVSGGAASSVTGVAASSALEGVSGVEMLGFGSAALGFEAPGATPSQATPTPTASDPLLMSPEAARPTPPTVPRPPAHPRSLWALTSSWRDEVVTWSRAVMSGSSAPTAPAAPAIDAMVARFALTPSLQPLVVLLYGAHLCGLRGAAPVDVARAQGRRWDEALGRGELAARGVAEYADSRVVLSPVIRRALDELPPLTGALIGEPGAVALAEACAVVAGDEPLAEIAERHRARVGGAILAARPDADLAAVVLEARAYGAAPLLRLAEAATAPDVRAIFVVADAARADQLGLPRLT